MARVLGKTGEEQMCEEKRGASEFSSPVFLTPFSPPFFLTRNLIFKYPQKFQTIERLLYTG